MALRVVRVALRDRSYEILIGHNHLSRLSKKIKTLALGRDPLIVTNPLVGRHCAKAVVAGLRRAGLNPRMHLIPDSERSKSLAELSRLLGRLAALDGAGRTLFIVALGGGVVGDLAGFAASVYRRGIPYVQIPTTLLAQVDSSIGGKTAVDLPAGKNLVGTIYQPRLVFVETSWLAKLPRRQLCSGLAEVIKCAVIRDPSLFRYLRTNRTAILRADPRALAPVIASAAGIKAAIVSADETESTGLRTVLNFGHTLGHAIEAAENYRGIHTHGEAISIGMSAAAALARRIGLCSVRFEQDLRAMLSSYRLPLVARGVSRRRVIDAISHDKKAKAGRLRWVLPTRIGHVLVTSDVSREMVIQVVAEHCA